MAAPTNGSFTTPAKELARQILQAQGLHGNDLDAAVQKSLTVFERLLGHQKSFMEMGASYPESRVLALAQDFSFIENGCGNPNCDTQKDKLPFVSGLKKCNRCKAMLYCSKECQRADWKDHKVTCKAANLA